MTRSLRWGELYFTNENLRKWWKVLSPWSAERFSTCISVSIKPLWLYRKLWRLAVGWDLTEGSNEGEDENET